MKLRLIFKEQGWEKLLEHPKTQEWLQQKGSSIDKLRDMFEEEWDHSLAMKDRGLDRCS